ncbi:MAG: D-alanyl-D-alanine carboxypeptidase [Burkholderiaceae bacterium]|nr:D-alanyl-D-alanine carboxypeptidase [Burkholderiaceae bacterium]
MLGPEYRWRTTAYLRGRLQDDVLTGDLVLRGGGDPKFVVEDLVEFAARMRRAGLRELRADLIVDDLLYDVGDESVERFDGDPRSPTTCARMRC